MMVLFAASEIYPYAKSGGLADVAHSLPEALRELTEIYTVMPLYNQVDREKHGIVYADISFNYWLGGVRHQFDIFHKEDSRTELFIYNPIICDREGLYHDSYGDFGDNELRFGLFNYAILELILHMRLPVKVLHLNDWQTALTALLAKQKYRLDLKVVFTIHNLAYQGVFDKNAMETLELDWDACFKPDRLEFFDRVNFMKAGIFYADAVTTVSPNYAAQIQTPAYGQDLDEMLRQNNHKLQGIINGISYDTFDPATDEALYKNYSVKKFENRSKNKKKLCKEQGLAEPKRPLFTFIGRLTGQKGVDLLLQNMEAFSELEANFFILGSGEKHYEQIFKEFENRFDNIKIYLGYDEVLSRQLYASADFLLMPSHFEPCGLNQMIAMHYGCVPIVSLTGGLADTVLDFKQTLKPHKGAGVGVTFEDHNGWEFYRAVTKALSLFSHGKKFEKIAKRNMEIDFSWAKPAKKYLKVYR